MSISAPKDHFVRRVARITIEFTSRFRVGRGEPETSLAADLAIDPNGLPIIPGESITGALRSAFGREYPQAVNSIFGSRRAGELGSRIQISDAHIHDQYDQVIDGIVNLSRIYGEPNGQSSPPDPILQDALAIQRRDSVRRHDRGAVDGGGKFETETLSRGHRFTLQMELVDMPESEDWTGLRSLWYSQTIAFGAKTRSGFGKFKVVRWQERSFKLLEQEDFLAYASLDSRLDRCPIGFEDPPGLQAIESTISISLRPLSVWCLGGGDPPPVPKEEAKPTLQPFSEPGIVWSASPAAADPPQPRGRIEVGVWVIPGTGIKGALSHRVAFHYNRLSGLFADALLENGSKPAEWLEQNTGWRNRAVAHLFGVPSGKPGQTQGCVSIDDTLISKDGLELESRDHVAIDAMTSGHIEPGLFTERLLRAPLNLQLRIHGALDWNDFHGQALMAALEDLCQGRLALGGGTGRGHGRFEACNPDWRNQLKSCQTKP
jgi:CRISPR/Cas system CSM-associated protein Csm3 (group 7 of RAMP superfamily)